MNRVLLPRLHPFLWALRYRSSLQLTFWVLHGLRSVNAATSCFDLWEFEVCLVALGLIDMIPVQVPQRHGQLSTSAKILSTLTWFSATAIFSCFHPMWRYFMDFFTDAARINGIYPSSVADRSIEG